MTKEELIEYKEKLSKLSEEENKKRDLYLRGLANGDIQGPQVGYPSIDKPWLKYYKENGAGIDVNLSNEYSMYRYLKDANDKFPESIALDYYDHEYTFGELFDLINKYANTFINYGVKPGDVVAEIMANTPEAIISFYALNKIGAEVQLIHPMTSENELKDAFNKTKTKLAICIDSSYYKVKNIIEDTYIEKVIVSSPRVSLPKVTYKLYPLAKKIEVFNINVKILKKKIKLFFKGVTLFKAKEEKEINSYLKNKTEICKLKEKIRRINLENSFDKDEKSDKFYVLEDIIDNSEKESFEYKWKLDEGAVLLSTGGTSGTPKMAELTNSNFNSMVQQFLVSFDKFERGDKAFTIMPIFHGFGLCSCIHLPLHFGVTSILVPKFDLKQFYKMYKTKKPNYIIGVPSIFDALIKNKKLSKNVGYSFVKMFVAGGDKLKNSKQKEFDEFVSKYGANAKISTGYGLSEGVAGVTLALDEYNVSDSVGIPMYGNTISIFNHETNEELSYMKEGEICLSGPTVMKGYYNNNIANHSTLLKHHDGKVYLHTGDLGYMNEDGIVYYTQRLKRMIVCNGYNIHSYEVENVIESLDFVDACELIGKKSDSKGEIPVAYIVLKEGFTPTLEVKKAIHEICKSNLAGYAIPQDFIFIKELPKTLLNKVAFKDLKEEKVKKIGG